MEFYFHALPASSPVNPRVLPPDVFIHDMWSLRRRLFQPHNGTRTWLLTCHCTRAAANQVDIIPFRRRPKCNKHVKEKLAPETDIVRLRGNWLIRAMLGPPPPKRQQNGVFARPRRAMAKCVLFETYTRRLLMIILDIILNRLAGPTVLA